jgi:hypothetical protein
MSYRPTPHQPTPCFAAYRGLAMTRRIAFKPSSFSRLPKPAIVAALVLLTGSADVFAQNLGFMHSSPITYLRTKDLASLTKTLDTALDGSADGQSTDWSNDGLGNSVPIKATLTPKDTADQNGMHCRHVAVTISAKDQDQSWLPLFCKTAQGWKMQKR